MRCIGMLTEEYRHRMYALLELYARPLSRTQPVICIDEKSLQLIGHSRKPLPMTERAPAKQDYVLFDAHTRSFAALGGIPRRGIYDNMKTAVDKVKKGKGRVVNARFAVMCAHYLFDADFRNVASGWEKGAVEKNVQDCNVSRSVDVHGAGALVIRREMPSECRCFQLVGPRRLL